MSHTLICTIGPSCNSREVLQRLKDTGCDIFRINLSHASIKDIYDFHEIAKEIGIEIAIDTEGAQLRTKLIHAKDILFKNGDSIKMNINGDLSENYPVNLTPKGILAQLKEEDLIRLDFNGVLAKVTSIDDKSINFKVEGSGKVGTNKGADLINRNLQFDDFTSKDLEAFEVCKSIGISKVFISFCQSTIPIYKVKKFIPGAWICSKIESKISIHNLPEIAKIADALLVDRGDLSREISILDIPFSQRGIIKVAKQYDTPCYIATNVLESLIQGDLPTRAELNDIVSAYEMGSSGIVLAAETAIGNKPILCAEIVKELEHKYYLAKAGLLFCDIDRGEITDEDMMVWINRYGSRK